MSIGDDPESAEGANYPYFCSLIRDVDSCWFWDAILLVFLVSFLISPWLQPKWHFLSWRSCVKRWHMEGKFCFLILKGSLVDFLVCFNIIFPISWNVGSHWVWDIIFLVSFGFGMLFSLFPWVNYVVFIFFLCYLSTCWEEVNTLLLLRHCLVTLGTSQAGLFLL